MNINKYTPKHIVLEEARDSAPKYKGMFSELYDLIKNKNVTLVTEKDGTVTGIWVDSGANNLMSDQLAGENFSRAYCSRPVMDWIEMILDLIQENASVEINDDEGYLKVISTGEVKVFDRSAFNRASSKLRREETSSEERTVCYESDSTDEIDLYDIEDELGIELDESSSQRELKKAIKNYTHRFVARGCHPYVEDGAIKGIRYGRRASRLELLD